MHRQHMFRETQCGEVDGCKLINPLVNQAHMYMYTRMNVLYKH